VVKVLPSASMMRRQKRSGYSWFWNKINQLSRYPPSGASMQCWHVLLRTRAPLTGIKIFLNLLPVKSNIIQISAPVLQILYATILMQFAEGRQVHISNYDHFGVGRSLRLYAISREPKIRGRKYRRLRIG